MGRWWSVQPGVPAAGHVTGQGYWHPGNGATCPRCE